MVGVKRDLKDDPVPNPAMGKDAFLASNLDQVAPIPVQPPFEKKHLSGVGFQCRERHFNLGNSIPIPQPQNLEDVWLGTRHPVKSQGWPPAMFCLSHAVFLPVGPRILEDISKWQTALTWDVQ